MNMANFTFYSDVKNRSLVDNFSSNTKLENVTTEEIVTFSAMFMVIGTIGITGNVLVIYIVFSDSKMRLSMTNMLIVNLAIADLSIMLFGIPEIVQFMISQGWLLGPHLCKIQRCVLVTALYASVMTLLALCIERYIAIVFPIKAHLMCTRRRTLFIIIGVWILALGFGTPTFLFNSLSAFNETGPDFKFCVLIFPGDHYRYFVAFKYTESVLFYFMPLCVQIVCYVVIAKHLFVGIKELHGQTVRQSPGNSNSKCSDTILARRGVIKMLVVSVLLYFLSYLPHQILLFYNTFSRSPFQENWAFLVGVTVLAYINSAGNPIIYCVFSEKYRRKFKAIFACSRANEQTAFGDTICLHSSTHATEYTQLFRKTTQRRAVVLHVGYKH